MKTKTARRLGGIAMAAIVVAIAGSAVAQSFPSRPIRMIVPFPPGNASDLAARILADPLGERLGQQVVVDNRPGATGALGIQQLMQANPDGHTLMMTSLAPITVNPALTKSLPYHPQNDLEPVAMVGFTSMMLVTTPSFPAKTVGEAIGLIRANPGKYSYAHIGVGTLSHMTMELFRYLAGLDMVAVPYRGSGQALVDVSSGDVQIMWDGMTSSLPQAQGGRVRPLAVSTSTRSIFAAEVPTLAEAGMETLTKFEVEGWSGMFAPARTPKEVIARVNAEVNRILADPAFRQRLMTQNLEAYPPRTPDDFRRFIAVDLERWTTVVREAKIEAPQ
jgi:tripartite-type tricarboxylate transporter receptor subunit TctC